MVVCATHPLTLLRTAYLHATRLHPVYSLFPPVCRQRKELKFERKSTKLGSWRIKSGKVYARPSVHRLRYVLPCGGGALVHPTNVRTGEHSATRASERPFTHALRVGPGVACNMDMDMHATAGRHPPCFATACDASYYFFCTFLALLCCSSACVTISQPALSSASLSFLSCFFFLLFLSFANNDWGWACIVVSCRIRNK